MKTSQLHFKMPQTIGEPVIAMRGKNAIGKIYQSLEGELPEYTAISKEGKQLCPPTSEWSEIETAYEMYSREISEQTLMNEYQAQAERTAMREHEITTIRKEKGYAINLNPLAINP